jgi:hypothetical protein
MKKVYILTFFFLTIITGFASNADKNVSPVELKKEFIGTLKYIEYTPFDTTYYKVYVTKDNIRVETFKNKNESENADKVIIYKLREKQIYAIKPSDHVYKTLNVDSDKDISIKGCEVILNKNNFKYINNYKCIQYRIKNKLENTDITYWIPEEDFPFYYEMISMKRSMQPVYKYFFMLPNSQVAFPMQTVERTMLREEKSSYKVIAMNETRELKDGLFTVPDDYQLLNE